MRRGATLLELAVTLVLLGVGLTAMLPAARRQRDRMAVLSAREATVGLLARARREARLSGGAALHVRREGGRAWVEAGGVARDTVGLEARFGVTIELSQEEVRLPFDALGIGRLSSRTVAFTRGDARAGLAVSAYGRVRRW